MSSLASQFGNKRKKIVRRTLVSNVVAKVKIDNKQEAETDTTSSTQEVVNNSSNIQEDQPIEQKKSCSSKSTESQSTNNTKPTIPTVNKVELTKHEEDGFSSGFSPPSNNEQTTTTTTSSSCNGSNSKQEPFQFSFLQQTDENNSTAKLSKSQKRRSRRNKNKQKEPVTTQKKNDEISQDIYQDTHQDTIKEQSLNEIVDRSDGSLSASNICNKDDEVMKNNTPQEIINNDSQNMLVVEEEQSETTISETKLTLDTKIKTQTIGSDKSDDPLSVSNGRDDAIIKKNTDTISSHSPQADCKDIQLKEQIKTTTSEVKLASEAKINKQPIRTSKNNIQSQKKSHVLKNKPPKILTKHTKQEPKKEIVITRPEQLEAFQREQIAKKTTNRPTNKGKHRKGKGQKKEVAKFNAKDKGTAMVNRDSIALRKEKDNNLTSPGSSPFSFGFSFQNLHSNSNL